MNTKFIEFNLYGCERKVVVNVSKIMDFFDNADGFCTIVLSAEENFKVKHSYEEVINMLQYYDTVFISRC
jgi:hypothetical protein